MVATVLGAIPVTPVLQSGCPHRLGTDLNAMPANTVASVSRSAIRRAKPKAESCRYLCVT